MESDCYDTGGRTWPPLPPPNPLAERILDLEARLAAAESRPGYCSAHQTPDDACTICNPWAAIERVRKLVVEMWRAGAGGLWPEKLLNAMETPKMIEQCGLCEAEIPEGTGLQCANCKLCDACGEYAADFAEPAEPAEPDELDAALRGTIER